MEKPHTNTHTHTDLCSTLAAERVRTTVFPFFFFVCVFIFSLPFLLDVVSRTAVKLQSN